MDSWPWDEVKVEWLSFKELRSRLGGEGAGLYAQACRLRGAFRVDPEKHVVLYQYRTIESFDEEIGTSTAQLSAN